MAYHVALEDLDYASVNAACVDLMRESLWFPVPAEIRAAAERHSYARKVRNLISLGEQEARELADQWQRRAEISARALNDRTIVTETRSIVTKREGIP